MEAPVVLNLVNDIAGGRNMVTAAFELIRFLQINY
jgi:hypothetical protein